MHIFFYLAQDVTYWRITILSYSTIDYKKKLAQFIRPKYLFFIKPPERKRDLYNNFMC